MVTNRELNFTHPVHAIGLHIGRAESRGAGDPGRPTVYDLADGATALADLEARATVGKLALRPWPHGCR